MNFTERVQQIVKTIPAGKLMTYGQVAKLAGNSKAARQVGWILNKNYDPGIPCHRVISKQGLGGYNRGAQAKTTILKQEGIDLNNLADYLAQND